jgi:hypothetical protein
MLNEWRVVKFGEDAEQFYATNDFRSSNIYRSHNEAYQAGVKIFSKFGYRN